MNNKALWDRAFKTDPNFVKPITGKDYQGSSPSPYWIVSRLTEELGPCGIGWGFVIENERIERFSDTDSLHVCRLKFWYVLEGARGEIEQMGQTKASYMTSGGKFRLDEDCGKKSITDALVKCASYLGFAGDIFSGRWDDSKYVAELRREFAEPTDPTKGRGVIKPTSGAGEGLAQDMKDFLEGLALRMIDHDKKGEPQKAADIFYDPANFPDSETQADERVYLHSLLQKESKLRAFIKDHSPYDQKKAA